MPEPFPFEESPRPPRQWPWWALLVVLCAVIFGIHFLEKEPSTTLPDPAKVASPVHKFYARYMMGVQNLERTSGSPAASHVDELEAVDNISDSVIDRLRTVAIAGEVASQEEALARLDAIDETLAGDTSMDAGFVQDARTLRAIYTDGPASIDVASRDELVRRHNWFGRLALAYGLPAGDPARAPFESEGQRALVGILVLLLIVLGGGIAGFACFVTGAILAGSGRLHDAFAATLRSTNPAEITLSARNCFLETVVLFLGSFLLISGVGAAVFALTGVDLTIGLVWIAPVVALWPRARGLSWPQLRRLIGWHRGAGIFVEIGAGIGGYLAGLPIMLLGILLSFAIISLTGTDASHPIVEEISAGGVGAIIALFLLASVWAPLVEETFFRGALYGHLRGLPGRGRFLPAVAAALITGFVFAIIHPQGFGGVPILMAIGFNLSLLREWRGSLIAPMTAHALHNSMATAVMVLFLA